MQTAIRPAANLNLIPRPPIKDVIYRNFKDMRCKRKNPNAPRKGSKIKVEPIRSLKDIQLIRRMLQEKPRDLALFNIGININLRASDLFRLRVNQVRDLEPWGFHRDQRKENRQVYQNVCSCRLNLISLIHYSSFDIKR